MTEVWMIIPAYPSYQISNLGRVKSFKSNKIRILRNIKGKIGYYVIELCNNGSKILFIHRLVALAFIPNPLNKCCINHKNGIKTDNRVENLEWVTYSENNQHAYDTGLKKEWLKPVKIIDLDLEFPSIVSCVKWLKANNFDKAEQSKISFVCRGKRNKHLGLHFEFIKEAK